MNDKKLRYLFAFKECGALVKKWFWAIAGLASLVWFLVRVIPKPSRAAYPCQQAAFPVASAFVLWLSAIGAAALSLRQTGAVRRWKHGDRTASSLLMIACTCYGCLFFTCSDSDEFVKKELAPTGGDESELESLQDSGLDSDSDSTFESHRDSDVKDALVAIVKGSVSGQNMSLDDIRAMVKIAVSKSGGLDFIQNGDSVLLKPNLITITTSNNMQLSQHANGVTTDWRIVRSVAELVRDHNPDGEVFVMEGSSVDTEDAFKQFGYTEENLGDIVDDIIPLEGKQSDGYSCGRPDDSNLVSVEVNGKSYVVDRRYRDADVVISLPVLKTHMEAIITGAVKNIGIGLSPVAAYPNENGWGCTRSFVVIDHTNVHTLSPHIHDIFAINPARFAVMDGLRGLANGPEPSWNGGNYDDDVKDMRLIIASADPVALDTVEALIAGCDHTQVDYLTLLNRSGIGTNDPDRIEIAGEKISDVQLPLSGHPACPNRK
ncbi:MAG: DUF362 domain-containing protein [Deltaproteobacteria bacterium]|nr:DUF362 domain-containing protein [Deltaproteobacteria bacterium]